jgi:hypothetical protein
MFTRHFMTRLSAVAIAMICLLPTFNAQAETLTAGDGQQWYKGVTHFHTLWSDGDAAPEKAVKWYKDNGYDFVAITDHNVLQTEEKWFPIDGAEIARLTPKRVNELRETFGEDWVTVKDFDGKEMMLLKTLPELKDHFEEPGTFLMIPGEEITNSESVHINLINLSDALRPARGRETLEIMNNAFAAIAKYEAKVDQPVLAHLNHPNFADHITAEEFAAVPGNQFFEIYNGHGGVRNWGDPGRHIVSTDRFWDIVLSLRLAAEPNPERPVYGVSTDDSHDYFVRRIGGSIPGRGWVMVLADKLDPAALINSMKAGKFYATSGVTLDMLEVTGDHYKVGIAAEAGVTYATQFIGTRKGADLTGTPIMNDAGEVIRATHNYSDEVGQVLLETTDNPAVYNFDGDEMYVRARVVSSKLQTDPFREGDFETAWTQPVVPR